MAIAPFKLSRLNAKVSVVDDKGRPTAAFLQQFNVQWALAIERQEAAQTAAIIATQAQVDRLTAFLNGTGEAITANGAFANGVVPTRVVAANAITNEAASFTSAVLAQTAATETTIQTVSYTTTGATLEVKANFFLTVWHPAAGGISVTIRLYRAAVLIYEQLFEAINGDLLQGWQTPIVIETPAAGTYAFTATVQTSNAGYATAQTSSRLLAVREFKR